MRVKHQLVNQSDPSANQNVERTPLLKMLKIKIYFVPLTSKDDLKWDVRTVDSALVRSIEKTIGQGILDGPG